MTGKKRRGQQQRHEARNEGVKVIGFQVRSATSAAGTGSTNHLLQYSTRSCWRSYNACAVSVSVAVENRPRSFIPVESLWGFPVMTLRPSVALSLHSAKPHDRKSFIRVIFTR
ncbi:hypothetical protein GQ600_13077 [Phytophthora cactorum]|nr:hypothetical protein GQ600_13077 [Phytophthora cactorum]